MIENRLNSLLKQNKLSINQLSKDTGISRQALTSIANNETKGIQYETVDILLDYFGIKIEDLFYNVNDALNIYFDSKPDENSVLDNTAVIVDVTIKRIKEEYPRIEYSMSFICEVLMNQNKEVFGVLVYSDKDPLVESTEGIGVSGDTVFKEKNTEDAFKKFKPVMNLIYDDKLGFSRFSANLISAALIKIQIMFQEIKVSSPVFVRWMNLPLNKKYDEQAFGMTKVELIPMMENNHGHKMRFKDLSGFTHITYDLTQW